MVVPAVEAIRIRHRHVSTDVVAWVGVNPALKCLGFGGPFIVFSPVRTISTTSRIPALHATFPAGIVFVFPVAIAVIDASVPHAVSASIPIKGFPAIQFRTCICTRIFPFAVLDGLSEDLLEGFVFGN